MNFNFKNITKDWLLTLVGLFLSIVITGVGLLLLYKGKIQMSEFGAFLGAVLPIMFGFGLAGRKNEQQ